MISISAIHAIITEHTARYIFPRNPTLVVEDSCEVSYQHSLKRHPIRSQPFGQNAVPDKVPVWNG